MFKGMSINVTLSQEQIEEIANLSADCTDKRFSKRFMNKEWLKSDIKRLEQQVANRDKMIVEREIIIDRYKNTVERYKDLVEKYKEKYGEI